MSRGFSRRRADGIAMHYNSNGVYSIDKKDIKVKYYQSPDFTCHLGGGETLGHYGGDKMKGRWSKGWY